MASSDDTCTDLLRAHVLDAGSVATFRWLANEARVGSDRAKRCVRDVARAGSASRWPRPRCSRGPPCSVLASFLEAHESELSATYCVSGRLRSPSGGSPPSFAVRVVAADQLDSCRAEFVEQPSVHVYAVGPKGAKLSDDAVREGTPPRARPASPGEHPAALTLAHALRCCTRRATSCGPRT